MNRMTWVAARVLCAVAIGLGVRSAFADDNKAKGDKPSTVDEKAAESFAGEWVQHTIHINGTSVDGSGAGVWSLTIQGNSIERVVTIAEFGFKHTGRFAVVEVGRGEVKVDLDVNNESGRNVNLKELWRVTDAGRLQMCLAGGDERPTGFAPKEGDKFFVLEFTRKEPKKK